MAERWVSQAKYYCKLCKVWMSDNKTSRGLHEKGTKHKLAVKESLKSMTKEGMNKAFEEEEMRRELQKIEKAAAKQYQQDLAASGQARGAQAPAVQSSYNWTMPQIPEAAAEYALKRHADEHQFKLTGIPVPARTPATKPAAAPAKPVANKDGYYQEDETSVTFFPPSQNDDEDEEQEQEQEEEPQENFEYAGEYAGEEVPPSAGEQPTAEETPQAEQPYQHPYGAWVRVVRPAGKSAEEEEEAKAKKQEDDDEEGLDEEARESAKNFKFVEKKVETEEEEVPSFGSSTKRTAEPPAAGDAPKVQFKKRRMEGKGSLRQKSGKLDLD